MNVCEQSSCARTGVTYVGCHGFLYKTNVFCAIRLNEGNRAFTTSLPGALTGETWIAMVSCTRAAENRRSLLLATGGGFLLALAGDHLAEHNHTVAVHERDA